MSNLFEQYNWQHALGEPAATGTIRTVPEDFIVEELLGFEPSGAGEHHFLKIEKTGENSEWIAKLLARHAGVKRRDIGFAGLKDRQAKTTQWFSVHLPGKHEIDWSAIETATIKLLEQTFHQKKLRRGIHKGNRFKLTIRDLEGDKGQIEMRLRQISEMGVPNYFGLQRFGIEGRNIKSAEALFKGEIKVRDRAKKGFYLSAARSFIFNSLVAERIQQDSWNKLLEGDVAQFDGSGSCFKVTEVDESILSRQQSMDIHPTASMWGRGELMTTGQAAEQEQSVADRSPLLRDGLVKVGLEQSRRATRLAVKELTWVFSEETVLEINFLLPSGGFATAVLNELIK